jgi:hypothetical protein
MSLVAIPRRVSPAPATAVVEVAYSIAAAVCGPIQGESIARALAPVEELTLEQALHGDALRRRGWSSLAEAIHVARDALHDVLGDGVELEHRGGSHWRAVVAVRDGQALAELLADVRAALRRWAPHRERVVVVGAVGEEPSLADRIRELLDADATDDRVELV